MGEFYRKSSVTKDVPISEIYSDKYGGLETTATIRGGRFSEKYALEFQVPDDPTFGAGKLVRLDLGLYSTGLTLADNSTAIPKVVAYRVNDVSQSGAGREITEGVGNKKSDDMLVYTSQLRDFASVEEVFNGTTSSGPDQIEYEPIQRTLYRKEKPYTTPLMMKKYGRQNTGYQGESIKMSQDSIATNYGVKPDEMGLNFTPPPGFVDKQSISYQHAIGEEGKDWSDDNQSYDFFVDTVNPSTPIILLTKDTTTKTTAPGVGFKGAAAALYSAEPLDDKPGETLFMFDNTAGVYWGNRDVIDNETYGNEVTSANSIFEYIRGADEFIGENKKSEGEAELFGVGAVRFSNKLQRTGGQSCQMYTFWKQQDDDPVSYPRKFPSGPKGRQECLIAKKNIPLPTKFPARPNWDNQDENHFSSSIEVDIYIESLEKAYVHESTVTADYINGVNISGTELTGNMITARRGLAICFSQDAPTSGQSFYDFVAAHGCTKSTAHAHSHWDFTTNGDSVGQEGSTSGNMWSLTPRRVAIRDDHDTNVTTAKNFSGVLIVMTPEGPAIIPSASDMTTATAGIPGGWMIDDNTKDIQVFESSVIDLDDDGADGSGTEDIVGKWIRLVFKVTPDGWTCYGPGGSTFNARHSNRGIYAGDQHKFSTGSSAEYATAQSTHSILQIVDLGADEIVKDRSLFGLNETDHYRINNHYVPGDGSSLYHGSGFGANSLQHWPKNLSIWMMNYKNNKNVNLKTDVYLEGPTSDTSSSVFLDSVRFSNFNFQIKNCSPKKYNPNAALINITPSSVWAGPDYPKVDNELLTGFTGEFMNNAPTVLSFGFKNHDDINYQNSTPMNKFMNFISNQTGTWLLFNGYQTANLGANEEIPDCNIRFGYSGGYNGEIEGGDTFGAGSSTSITIDTTPGDGSTMNDFYIVDIDNDNINTTDSTYEGLYLTFRSGLGKDQTRRIAEENYVGPSTHVFALQPMLHTTPVAGDYLAIHSEVFGNQFKNDGIGSHRNPGKGYYSLNGSASQKRRKAMFTSRAHTTRYSDVSGLTPNADTTGDNAYWSYPDWRYNDVGHDGNNSSNAVAATLDVDYRQTSGAYGHLPKHGYGTAQAYTTDTTHIKLQTDMDDTDNAYNGLMVIIEGGTGVGQIREITDYTGSTKLARVNKAWSPAPDATSKYRLRIAPYVGAHWPYSSGQRVSAGTHNNWFRRLANSETTYGATIGPDGGPTGIQGMDDMTAKFECKWFNTGFTETGGAAISGASNITLGPHQWQILTGDKRLSGQSDDYFPMRAGDTVSVGSVNQTGHVEMPVTSIVSGSLNGVSGSLVYLSSTALPAAIHSQVDRPVYTKLPTSINNFNRKGFAWFSMNNDHQSSRPYKRENLAASVRVTEINNPSNGQITLTVDNVNTLSSDDDEEYIIYLYGQMATMNATSIAAIGDTGSSQEANPYSATGLKIIDRDAVTNTVTFVWDGKANNGDLICTYDNLPALMISPYRYWLYLVIDCTDETGQKALNSRSYRSVSWMDSNENNMAGYLASGEALGATYDHANVAGTLAARQNFGSTWNEFSFNDATVGGVPGAYINDWELTRMEKGSSLDVATDYGYGAFNAEDNTGGYCGKRIFYKNPSESQTENIMNLPFLVQKGGIEPKQDLTLLLAFEDEALPHTLTLKARNAATPAYDPAIYSVYWDDRPAHPKLSILPDEKDAFIPVFKWEAGDADLWYGLLHIDNRNIPSQYHNMIGHIPLNEDRATTHGGIYFENGAGTNTAAVGGTFTNTREGLAGWAKNFDGVGNYLKFADSVNFATKPLTEMTIVIHAIPDAAQAAQANLITKHRDSLTSIDYEIYIDTDEKVNAKIKTSGGGTVLHLKSNTILPRDGQTPVSIILTFDKNLKGGNMKLFIDGKLEDQSGLADAVGTANRLKRGDNISQGTGHLYIGSSATWAGIPMAESARNNFYDGKIEEIVIYNKCLYPVNPKLPEFKLDKPLREVDNGSPVSYQGRLFMKDYHNIRGNRTLDVASSSGVSFSKAGFRLS